jgi:hypothetical protein
MKNTVRDSGIEDLQQPISLGEAQDRISYAVSITRKIEAICAQLDLMVELVLEQLDHSGYCAIADYAEDNEESNQGLLLPVGLDEAQALVSDALGTIRENYEMSTQFDLVSELTLERLSTQLSHNVANCYMKINKTGDNTEDNPANTGKEDFEEEREVIAIDYLKVRSSSTKDFRQPIGLGEPQALVSNTFDAIRENQAAQAQLGGDTVEQYDNGV